MSTGDEADRARSTSRCGGRRTARTPTTRRSPRRSGSTAPTSAASTSSTRRAALTAGRLAELMGLTTGAITTVLDRLERAGFARRVRDESDRRRVRVELDREGAREKLWPYYEPLARDVGAALLALQRRAARAPARLPDHGGRAARRLVARLKST